MLRVYYQHTWGYVSTLTFGTCFVAVKRRDVPLDQGYVKFVGDVLCHLMAAYPQCLWKSKVVVHKSVIVVFAALSKWTVIDSLVDRFMLHTLMLSISNVTDPDQAVRGYLTKEKLFEKCPDCLIFYSMHCRLFITPTRASW